MNSQIFHQDLQNEGLGIVEGSVPPEMEKETAHKIRAGDVGAPATLGSIAPTDWKNRVMVINLD
jgi:hypothetical protein